MRPRPNHQRQTQGVDYGGRAVPKLAGGQAASSFYAAGQGADGEQRSRKTRAGSPAQPQQQAKRKKGAAQVIPCSLSWAPFAGTCLC